MLIAIEGMIKNMKLNEMEIKKVIEKLQKGEGADMEQEKWINDIRESVPYYEKIIRLLFWKDELLSPNEIIQKAKEEHNPIIL